MNSFFCAAIIIVFSSSGFSQNSIEGFVPEDTIEKDSIFIFAPSPINLDYFEKVIYKSRIANHAFTIPQDLTFPHMFRIRLRSENDIIPHRRGFYFIDEFSKNIHIDSTKIGGTVDGKTGDEYKKIFLPFFLDSISDSSNIDSMLWVNNDNQEFDEKLLNYIIIHPESYVGLWFLIHTFSENGYSDLRFKTLNMFSTTIKKHNLWKLLYNEFTFITIRDNQKFPLLNLKNFSLENEQLELPKAKYTFIDFWFSRCRPCLEQMPHVISLYDQHHAKGFNVIGISTDKTANIDLWKKRIIEKNIPWKNYLDENALEASKEKIHTFPKNYLLDKDGIVIKKDISLEELEEILKANL